MFGVVPKSLWQKTNPSDSNNMIDMASRCMLIEDKNKLVLIDSGMGNKQSEKFFSYYFKLINASSIEAPYSKHPLDHYFYPASEKYFDSPFLNNSDIP